MGSNGQRWAAMDSVSREWRPVYEPVTKLAARRLSNALELANGGKCIQRLFGAALWLAISSDCCGPAKNRRPVNGPVQWARLFWPASCFGAPKLEPNGMRRPLVWAHEPRLVLRRLCQAAFGPRKGLFPIGPTGLNLALCVCLRASAGAHTPRPSWEASKLASREDGEPSKMAS